MRTYQKNMSRNRSGIDEVSNYYFRNNINGLTDRSLCFRKDLYAEIEISA